MKSSGDSGRRRPHARIRHRRILSHSRERRRECRWEPLTPPVLRVRLGHRREGTESVEDFSENGRAHPWSRPGLCHVRVTRRSAWGPNGSGKT
jgi:hypothetical protein